MGWSELLNGELLDQAVDAKFDVLLTSDSNIKHQQNLRFRRIAVVVLRARDNRLKTHIPMMQDVLQTLLIIRPGEVVEVPERLKTR